MRASVVTSEFFELGLGAPIAISAAHSDGVRELVDLLLADIPYVEEEKPVHHAKFAMVGRPNVGKSTLVNSILGEERVIAFDQPGTKRDRMFIDFERNGRPYTIVDTAGVRRRAKVDEAIEKFSVIKTMQAIEACNVVVLVLDARQEVSDQDATLAGFIIESGRSLVVGVNKWEGMDEYDREVIKREIGRKLNFLDFAKFHYISALKGMGVGDLLVSIDAAYAAAMANLSTPRLTRALQLAVEKQVPPRSGLMRPKMRYAHQGGINPPRVIIHGSALENIPDSYRRYLERTFVKVFNLQGTPLRVEFKQGHNPFADRKPKPTAKR